MKSWLGAAIAAMAMSVPAGAAVVTLSDVTPDGSNFRFTYGGTLAPDEGAVDQSKLIIFDFAGYVDGSIFSTIADFVGSTELSSGTNFIAPGYVDDPTLPNLVFTYTGEDLRASGGPYPPLSFTGFGALSSLGGRDLGAFTSFGVKNNPPAVAGTDLITIGNTQIPSAVPEPATWAMMLAGFGLVGTTMRRRKLRHVLT